MTIALVAIAMPGSAGAQAAPGLAYCNQLASYYDHYNRRGEGQLSAGDIDRVIGLERCRKGEVEAGIEQLKRAITLLGFEPPKPSQ